MSNFYYENKRFIKYKRYIVPGTKAMLAAYPKLTPLVKIRHMDVRYHTQAKSFYAVKDLNLNIYEGEVLGLVGESGSGKSTIGKALVGLVNHQFGSIEINNQKLPQRFNQTFKNKAFKKTMRFLVQNVQMIFQDPTNSLNPHKNVFKIVSEGLVNIKNSQNIFLIDFNREFLKTVFENNLQKAPGFVYPMDENAWLKPIPNTVLGSCAYIRNELIKTMTAFIETNFVQKRIDAKQKLILLNDLKSQLAQYELDFAKYAKLSEKEYTNLLVSQILQNVGLDQSVMQRFPLEFSGGQQQRIGISRAVVLRPKFLVADEPISALDVSIQAQVVNIFKSLQQKYNITILFIAHDLRMIEYISDRIAVINKGILLEIGPTDEIINNAKHPYTKALLEAVPSIEAKKGSLLGYVYNPKMHNYTQKVQPEWLLVQNNHFVLATKDELNRWQKGLY